MQENVYASVKWDLSPERPCRPYVFIYAYNDIPAGSEIVLNYGPQYWKVMAKELRAAHAHEWAKAEMKCRRAIECLRDAEVREAKMQGCLHVDLNSETTFSVE